MHLLDVLLRRCYLSYLNRRWPERRSVCGGGLFWTQILRVTGDLTTHWDETQNRALRVCGEEQFKGFQFSFLLHMQEGEKTRAWTLSIHFMDIS